MRYICTIALVYLSIFNNVWARDINNAECDRGEFSNVVYFLDVNSIALVSKFFHQIPSAYFVRDDTLFEVSKGIKPRTEIYFDDNDFSLLKKKHELFVTEDINLPIYRTGREQVIFKDNNSGNFESFETKSYKKKVTPLDKHKLFGRIKRKQRQLLIDKLGAISTTTAEEFSTNFQVQHHEVVQFYRHYGVTYGTITLDQFDIADFGIPNTFSLLRFELYLDKMNQLQEKERTYLLEAFCNARSGFNSRFIDIPAALKFGYSEYHQLALDLLPSRSFFKKYPMLYQLGQIFILLIIGFLFIFLLVGRYRSRHSSREVTINQIVKENDI